MSSYFQETTKLKELFNWVKRDEHPQLLLVGKSNDPLLDTFVEEIVPLLCEIRSLVLALEEFGLEHEVHLLPKDIHGNPIRTTEWWLDKKYWKPCLYSDKDKPMLRTIVEEAKRLGREEHL